jgi:hypothetical protein
VISEFALLRAVCSIGRVPVTVEAAILEALHDGRDVEVDGLVVVVGGAVGYYDGE